MTTKVDWQPVTKGQRSVVADYIEREVVKLMSNAHPVRQIPIYTTEVVYIESVVGVHLQGKRFGVIIAVNGMNFFVRAFVVKHGIDIVQVVDVFKDGLLLFNENDLTISATGETVSTYAIKLIARNMVKLFDRYSAAK